MRKVTIPYKEYQDLISQNKVEEIEALNFAYEMLKEDLNDEILLNQETYKRNRFLTMALAVTSVSILFLLGILAIIINN